MHKINGLPKDPVSGAPQGEDQIFEEVLGPECKGRKRGMGRVNFKENDYSPLRAKLQELTEQLAERDKKDAEREKRDAERENREIETARHIKYLMAQIESLSQSVNLMYGTSLPQMPHLQTLAPYYQPLFVPHQRIPLLSQHQMSNSHEQPQMSQMHGGFTELLQRGMDYNFEMVARRRHQEEHEVVCGTTERREK